MSVATSHVSDMTRPGNAGPIVTSVASDQRERMLASNSFRFRHGLSGHPAMTLPAIRKIAEQMLSERRFDQVFYKTGVSMATGKYSDSESVKSIIKVFENLNTAGAWLRLTRVDEVNSEFDAIVEQFYGELSELYQQDIKSRTLKTFVTLFISSPRAYTNYHLDHTWNFLLQISGRKTDHLYDPNDPQVLTQGDKEGWYMELPQISPRAHEKDMIYDLAPGDGVHHPVNAPHWVQNGPEVSISLSLGLCLHTSNRDAKVYQANYLLRRLGFNPTPPRLSERRDSMKASFISLWSDRNPKSFDQVVHSGATRLKRILRIGAARHDPGAAANGSGR